MRAAIYTLGCKVNQYETQAMEQELRRRGHELVDFEDSADAYIIAYSEEDYSVQASSVQWQDPSG